MDLSITRVDYMSLTTEHSVEMWLSLATTLCSLDTLVKMAPSSLSAATTVKAQRSLSILDVSSLDNCYIMAGTFTRRESGDRSTRTKQEDKGSECKLQRVT